MAENIPKRKPEEVLEQTPQAKEYRPEGTDMLARLRDAKISKTNISMSETSAEEMKRTVAYRFCVDFFGACYDKAKKEGTAKELNNTEMKQYFG